MARLFKLVVVPYLLCCCLLASLSADHRGYEPQGLVRPGNDIKRAGRPHRPAVVRPAIQIPEAFHVQACCPIHPPQAGHKAVSSAVPSECDPWLFRGCRTRGCFLCICLYIQYHGQVSVHGAGGQRGLAGFGMAVTIVSARNFDAELLYISGLVSPNPPV